MFRRLLNIVGWGLGRTIRDDTQGSCEDLDQLSTSSGEASAFNEDDLVSELDFKFHNGLALEEPVKHSAIQSIKQSTPWNVIKLQTVLQSISRYITVSCVTQDECLPAPGKLIIGKDAKSVVKIVLPDGLKVEPSEGDKLLVRYMDDGQLHGTEHRIFAESVSFLRTREDVLVHITEHYQGLNGKDFVFFEKNACCAREAIPFGSPADQGALYKVSFVESRQPRNRVWRAHSLEFMVSLNAQQVPEEIGIQVDSKLVFGSIALGMTLSKTITIRNADPESRKTLVRMSVTGLSLKLIGPVQISEPHKLEDSPKFFPSIDYHPFKELQWCRLSSFEEQQITVRVVGMIAGKLEFVVHFHFLGREMRACAVTAHILQPDGAECGDIISTVEHPPRNRNLARNLCRQEAIERLKDIVRSERLAGIIRSPRLITLENEKPSNGWSETFREHFHIPEDIMDVLNHEDVTLETAVAKYPILGQPLSIVNYSNKFHLLLFLEEHSEMVSVRSFDLVSDGLKVVEDVTYRLNVDGLQEQRPSLLRGDIVSVRGVADSEGPRYQGRIVKVGVDSIDLCFDQKFVDYNKQNLSLDFAFVSNRNCYRRLHNVLNAAKRNLSRRLFFPDISNRDRCVQRVTEALAAGDDLEFVNQALNEQQRRAVRMVVLGRCQPMAHIIFGPPGTGKTITVVETVIQIFKRNPKSRILVCAPSNAATDLIGQKIIESSVVFAGALRRILCMQRSHDSVPVELSESVQTGCREDLPKEHRIVLLTCLSASYLVEQIQDFTHVIVDEAGFATEPEILIPLAAVAGRPDVQVVLAGDPNQLGPVVYSAFAKELGLEKSFLSRLLELPAYADWADDDNKLRPFCPFLVSKLDLNYRAVESLLKIPSKFFYNCELKSHIGDDKNIYAPRLGLPAMTFWPVRSMETRESRSPSIANPGQVNVVVQLMQNLLTIGILVDDIGVITPYRLQAAHIRKALLAVRLPVPKIGTVEEFQGQERNAIILSTVRARCPREYDSSIPVKDILGFVACPKRTNVALTRARFILMLVGDPYVLSLDKHWKGILRYCCAKNLYQKDLYNDCDYPPPDIVATIVRCTTGAISDDPEAVQEQLVPVTAVNCEVGEESDDIVSDGEYAAVL